MREPEDSTSELDGASLLRWGAMLYLAMALGALFWMTGGVSAISASLLLGRAETPAAIVVEIALGVVTAAVVLALWWGARRTSALARELESQLAGIVGSLTRDQAWALALLSGFSEELLFRGAMLQAWGFGISTLLFGLLHLGRGRALRLWFLLALAIGALLGGLTLWRGSLLAPILAHVLINGIQLARLRSGPLSFPGPDERESGS